MKKIFIISLFLFGCSSNVYIVQPERNTHEFPKEKVYITNPELAHEYEILKQSNIFELSNEETETKKIKLYKMERRLACGNPAIVTFFTLGLLPAYFPDTYIFSFALIENGNIENQEYVLPVVTKYSLYETFMFFHMSEEEVLSTTLRTVYADQLSIKRRADKPASSAE